MLWQGRIGRFGLHHASPRLNNDATEVMLEFDPLPPGSVVVARMGSTTRAGLASVASSSLVMVDDTPPLHPKVQGCTPGGMLSNDNPAYDGGGPDGYYFQNITDGLIICWHPDPGFVDHESGLWTLQWQVARWVVDASVWDTAIPTQTLSPEFSRQVHATGMLNLSQEQLVSVSAFLELRHPLRYRLGLRAVNRAGVVSCGPGVGVCEKSDRAGTSECACPDPTGKIDNWAATQFDASVPFAIDVVPPSCLFAVVRLCDPRASRVRMLPHIVHACLLGRPANIR